MNPDMGTPAETQQKATKIDILRSAIPLVNSKIGRPIDNTETRAIGFVIEKRWSGSLNANSFLHELCSVKDNDQPKEVAFKIHIVVYNTFLDEVGRRIEENLGNHEEVRKLQALQKTAEIGHTASLNNYQNPNGKIYIGGVPEYWLPEWVKSHSTTTS